jgi:ABC-type molybdate transport system substrate-binding protein
MSQVINMKASRRIIPFSLLPILSLGLWQPSASAAGAHLTLVAFSTPAAAYTQIIPAFQATAAGKDVSITPSYGASGDQSQAVANGQPADVVNFSLAPDMLSLVHRNLVASNWDKNAYHGMITDSIVVFVVRKGNPKHIKTWNDLIKKGSSSRRRPRSRRSLICRNSSTTSRSSRPVPAMRSPPLLPAKATSCSPMRTRRSAPSRRGSPWTT